MEKEQSPGKNKRDFNKVAALWDEKPRRVALASAVAEAIKQNLTFDAKLDALEFGCGTGLVTFNLVELLHHITVVDSAEGMLAVVEQKAAQLGIDNITAVHSNSTVPSLPAQHYDLVFSSMVLHHVADISHMLQVLITSLKPGGTIALADLDAEDGTFHADPVGVEHHGVDRQWLCDELVKLGLVNVQHTTAYTIVKKRPQGEQAYPVFFVWAQKPA
ncbi:MAG: class I SAM-dependent methyltransferase [Desulfuromonas sp.]|nr:class I SAM-dependent methyltransferase [Desulfuromonas sp.]